MMMEGIARAGRSHVSAGHCSTHLESWAGLQEPPELDCWQPAPPLVEPRPALRHLHQMCDLAKLQQATCCCHLQLPAIAQLQLMQLCQFIALAQHELHLGEAQAAKLAADVEQQLPAPALGGPGRVIAVVYGHRQRTQPACQLRRKHSSDAEGGAPGVDNIEGQLLQLLQADDCIQCSLQQPPWLVCIWPCCKGGVTSWKA